MYKRLHQRIVEIPYMHIVDSFEAVDVDTKEDFELAQAVAMFKASRQK